ncbi:unnamed protein product [Heligmosomoides polygyrus]|uniref:SH2 domain-containing protein n=1 Tax=Heligmosomoides polygyrus TaxID=6339 RepID=A0A183F5K7_HELPZ|nr:unnamed protein product [Heligmosomoides polygyrus]
MTRRDEAMMLFHAAGLLTFASDRFNVHSITELVDGVVKENALDGFVQYSIERIDEDGDEELIPRYQIAIFQTGTYDETLSRIIITKLNQKFISKRTNGMEYVSAEYEWSITDHSYAMERSHSDATLALLHSQGLFILRESSDKSAARVACTTCNRRQRRLERHERLERQRRRN